MLHHVSICFHRFLLCDQFPRRLKTSGGRTTGRGKTPEAQPRGVAWKLESIHHPLTIHDDFTTIDYQWEVWDSSRMLKRWSMDDSRMIKDVTWWKMIKSEIVLRFVRLWHFWTSTCPARGLKTLALRPFPKGADAPRLAEYGDSPGCHPWPLPGSGMCWCPLQSLWDTSSTSHAGWCVRLPHRLKRFGKWDPESP